MEIELKSSNILKLLVIVIIFLILAHIIYQLSLYYFGRSYGLYLFDLDQEENIPTFFASLLLLSCSAILSIITISKKFAARADWIYWAGLAIIFLFLSVDEMISLHEKLTPIVRTTFNTSGFLYFAWVIPYSLLLILFLSAYLRFIINLPSRTRLLFIVAGSIYVSGALGLELLGGSEVVADGYESPIYIALSSLEESLEMLGVVTFIYALLLYISNELRWIRLSVVQ